MKSRKLSRNKKKSWKKLEKDANVQYSQHLQEKSFSNAVEAAAPQFILDRSNVRDKSKVVETPADLKRKKTRGYQHPDQVLVKKLSKLPPRKIDIAKRFPRESDKRRPADSSLDAWEETPESDDEHGIKRWYLTATKQIRVRPVSSTELQRRLKRTRGAALAASIPKVAVPPPGASYNPTALTHQQLMEEAAVRQAAEDAEELRLHRQMTSKEAAPTEQQKMEEMEAGLFDEEDAEEAAADEAGGGGAAAGKVAKVSKKTRVQRNKLQRAQDRRSAANRLKTKEGLLKQLDASTVVGLRRALLRDERKQKIRRQTKKEADAARPQRLGPHRLSSELAPETLAQLPEELAGSLRKLKPERGPAGALMEQLARRGVVEHRVKVRLRNKYKRKHYEKK